MRNAAACGLIAVALACGDGTGPKDGVRVAGQAVLAGTDASPTATGVRLTLSAAGRNVSGDLERDARFEINVPSEIADASSATATIDASPGTSRVYRPILLSPTTFDTLRTRLERPLLVARSVSIPATSTLAGNRTVSLLAAFTPPCGNLGSVNCDSFFPQRFLTNVALWPEAELPVPLAFDRERSIGLITPADSVTLWTAIAKLHADLGRVMFRPSVIAPGVARDTSGYVAKTVLVRVDSNLIGVSGETAWIWDASDNIVGARIRLPTPATFASPYTMPHELMHALGFAHTCAWPSLMGGHGCNFQNGLQAADVAAFTLAYAIKRAIVARTPTTTLGDARRGETQVEGVTTAAAAAALVVSRPITPMGAIIR